MLLYNTAEPYREIIAAFAARWRSLALDVVQHDAGHELAAVDCNARDLQQAHLPA